MTQETQGRHKHSNITFSNQIRVLNDDLILDVRLKINEELVPVIIIQGNEFFEFIKLDDYNKFDEEILDKVNSIAITTVRSLKYSLAVGGLKFDDEVIARMLSYTATYSNSERGVLYIEFI